MDHHFDAVLGGSFSGSSSSNHSAFIPAKKFDGKKDGYFFQNGDRGLGYYLDKFGKPNKYLQPELAAAGAKRKFENESSTAEDNSNERESKVLKTSSSQSTRPPASSSTSSGNPDIDEYIEQAEKSNTDVITQLDAGSLKQLILTFEKRITKNQKLRMKYPEEPEKFMESEIELHTEIQNLFVIAAFPELYPILFQTNAIKSILEMINHENTDISLTTITLLQEMTDVESFKKEKEEEDDDEDDEEDKEKLRIAQTFMKQLQDLQGFELLIQNLSRLEDEKHDEDAQGVYNTMTIVENSLTIQPLLSTYLMEMTNIAQYLLVQLKKKKSSFDANKLYFSEILSMLLQSNPSNQAYITMKVKHEGEDGMELLLQAIANYRKKDVEISDEQECVENLFLCLNNILLLRNNQDLFIKYEGIELLNKIYYEQKYASINILKTFNYLLMKNYSNILLFIDLSGLKILFSLFMKKGMKKELLKKMVKNDEYCISILSQISIQFYQHYYLTKLTNNSSSSSALTGMNDNNKNTKRIEDCISRYLSKFIENNYEKLDYLITYYYQKYYKKYEKTIVKLQTIEYQIRKEQGNESDLLQEFLNKDNLYLEKLEGGLFELQQIVIVLSYLLVTATSQVIDVVKTKLHALGFRLEHLLTILREMIVTLKEEAEEAKDSEKEDPNQVSENIDQSYLQTLVHWAAVLSKLSEGEDVEVKSA